jgi:hypothetical protein
MNAQNQNVWYFPLQQTNNNSEAGRDQQTFQTQPIKLFSEILWWAYRIGQIVAYYFIIWNLIFQLSLTIAAGVKTKW